MYMKKYNIFVHVVANAVLVVVLFSLYVACVPAPGAGKTASPIYRGDFSQKKIALMFGVYGGTEYVEKILEVLENYDAVGTFFVGGRWVEKNMEAAKKITERNEIGNYGYLCLDHAGLSYARNREEILLCHKLTEKVTGKKMSLFSPPSGGAGRETLQVCEELRYKVIMWSKDAVDRREESGGGVYARATKGVRNGDLILMRPTENTAKALPDILKFYRSRGFETATAGDLTIISPR